MKPEKKSRKNVSEIERKPWQRFSRCFPPWYFWYNAPSFVLLFSLCFIPLFFLFSSLWYFWCKQTLNSSNSNIVQKVHHWKKFRIWILLKPESVCWNSLQYIAYPRIDKWIHFKIMRFERKKRETSKEKEEWKKKERRERKDERNLKFLQVHFSKLFFHE